MASKTVTRCIYKDLYGKPYKLDWVAKVVFLIQMPLTFGGRCNHYLWDIRLKIHRSPNFREQSLTIGWGGGGEEGWYYLKNAGPKILAPLRLTAQNPAPSKNVCPQNCNPPLITFWVFECYMVRIHISVTLRQLFHWNKKVLLFHVKALLIFSQSECFLTVRFSFEYAILFILLARPSYFKHCLIFQ